MSLMFQGQCFTQEERARAYDHFSAMSDDQLDRVGAEYRALLESEKGMELRSQELDNIINQLKEWQAVRDVRRERKKTREGTIAMNGGKDPYGFFRSGLQNGPCSTRNRDRKDLTDMNETEKRNTQEYREAFFKYAMGQTMLPEERALVTSLTGAAVIPTTTFDQIIQNVQKESGLISRVRVLNIPGKLSVPQSDINTPATWHTEGEEIADSNLPPTNVTLTGFELAKLFSMSAATQAMSITAFEGYLIEELTRCTRDALAEVIFTGNGAGKATGILEGFAWGAGNSLVINPNDVWSSLTAAMALLPANFRQNAVFTMNSVMFFSYLAAQYDANGNPLFVKDQTTGLPLSLMGKTIVLDDFCPDNTIILGDPSYYFLNFSQPMAVERSGEAGFTKATIVYRSLAVVDGKPVAPAFIKLTKAA